MRHSSIGSADPRLIGATLWRKRIGEKGVEWLLPEDDPKQNRPDISFTQKQLDWEPAIQLEEGLAQTIAYFERFAA